MDRPIFKLKEVADLVVSIHNQIKIVARLESKANGEDKNVNYLQLVLDGILYLQEREEKRRAITLARLNNPNSLESVKRQLHYATCEEIERIKGILLPIEEA